MFGWSGGNKKKTTNEISEAPAGGWNFDPTGFERAANALKEIDASPNSKQALAMIKEQEVTQQLEHQRMMEEAKAVQADRAVQQTRVAEEERRKTLAEDSKQRQQQAYYKDQLQRKRAEDERQATQFMREAERRKDEEMHLRIEAKKMATLAREQEMRAQLERDRAIAEADGRIKQERENFDLRMEELKAQATQQRETVLESIKLVGKTIGEGVSSYFSDHDKMLKTVGTLTAIAAGVYTAKVGAGVLGRQIEARLGKPVLVRETSKRTALDAVRSPFSSMRRLAQRITGSGAEDPLKGVVLEEGLAARLASVARATVNTKKNGAPYRHLLMHGHPGTGKTMFAKNLARSSGMDYAILTGGDVAPLGRDAVPEMHKLFDWSQTSSRGLLLFVDEADAFLRKRGGEDASEMSEDLRNALNAFLYRTGEPSKDFMVVFASNQPEQLDWAIQDRVDEMVEFHLPGVLQREAMLQQYFRKYVTHPEGVTSSMPWAKTTQPIKTPDLTSDDDVAEVLRGYADRTDGFSGREIEKLAIAWQAAAYGSDAGALTRDMMDLIVDIYLEQNEAKRKWR